MVGSKRKTWSSFHLLADADGRSLMTEALLHLQTHTLVSDPSFRPFLQNLFLTLYIAV